MLYVNKDIENLYRVKFHEQRGEVLRLDMNENPIGLPKDFVEEVKEKITPSFIATYPEKDELIELIAQHNSLSNECITLTAGSDEAMRMVFQCFGEKGSDAVTVNPTFEMYDIYSKMFGLNHIYIDYSDDLTVSVDNILSSVTEKASLVILLNPNSPVGTTYTEDEFIKIVDKASDCGAVVIVDEAYHYFYSPTFMPLINKYDNLIVLRTFSKLCSIAGLRVGYAASNKKIIDMMENAESTFNVNSVGILFATEVLKRPDIMEKIQREEAEGKVWITQKLKDSGYQFYSAEGNYVLFKPNRRSEEIVSKMKLNGVWIRDYKRGVLEGWIRVSTGNIGSMMKFWDAFERCGDK